MRSPDHTRRVVVTGLGVVSPVGNDIATAWGNLVNGVSGLGEITRFDASGYDQHVAGEVHDFEPTAWMDPKAAVVQAVHCGTRGSPMNDAPSSATAACPPTMKNA